MAAVPTMHMRRLALLLSCTLPATAALADTYPRQSGVDVQHYAFTLELSDDHDRIAGVAAIEVRFTRDGESALRSTWPTGMPRPARGWRSAA